MAITRISPNTWRITASVRVPGRAEPAKKQETFTGTKTEAEARRTAIIQKLREPGSLTVSRDISTFSEAVDLYREKKKVFSAPHSRKIDYLVRETGHVYLNEYADRFESWLRILKQTPGRNGKRSMASLNRYIEIARAVFGLLVELEFIEKNPLTKARFPKGEEKPRDRYLTEIERLRLINVIREFRPYILPFVQYSLAIPCRKTELTMALRSQYDRFTNTIYIPDTKAGIPVTKPVPAFMESYFQSIPPECPYLFYRKDETGYHPLGTIQKPWAYCLKKAGLNNVRIHDLRHVAASDLYASGVSEREIMDVAGWKTPMLSTYRHRDSLKTAQKINSFFRESETPPVCYQQSINSVTTKLPHLPQNHSNLW